MFASSVRRSTRKRMKRTEKSKKIKIKWSKKSRQRGSTAAVERLTVA
jgi:hypothetical protein